MCHNETVVAKWYTINEIFPAIVALVDTKWERD